MSETPQIREVGRVMAPVTDVDRAISFYVDVLGLELRADVPFGDGERWVEVAPRGAVTAIALVPATEHYPAGVMTGIILTSADIDADHAVLRARGVDVDAEVMRAPPPVPPMAFFRDADGNHLLLVQG